jgi:hypothetical protein
MIKEEKIIVPPELIGEALSGFAPSCLYHGK